MKAPDSPPTAELAIIPPFLTASLSIARQAVVPQAPTLSKPISSKMCATLSPITGVGASDKSTIPQLTPSLFAVSRQTREPTRVILKAVSLIFSAT